MAYIAPDCAICLEPLVSDLHGLTCGHVLHSHCATQWLHGDGKKSCPLCKRPDTSSYPLYFELRALAGSGSSQGDAVASSGDAARVVKLRVRVSELLADQMSVMGAKIALEQRCERCQAPELCDDGTCQDARTTLVLTS